ncbi:MAG: hypothetical protein DME70_09010 [Verrucomicrobia bacterium]|nr:MAG: hypothetical protein DME70_09010 [Verrucomicrobiota bacterium]
MLDLASIRSCLPKDGLFAEKDFLLSPDPFPVDDKFAKELEQLGHRLYIFQRACNELYQRSAKGKQPAWIAQYLDAGKTPELIEFSRQKEFRDDVPLVIRPDLILTESGYTIAEIDSVPGGIGLTGWLNQTYANLGRDVIGGRDGMLDGFRSLLPDGGDIVISEEASTYRPEMNWLAAQLNARGSTQPLNLSTSQPSDVPWRVVDAETYQPKPGRNVYRFFELFDLPNLPRISALLDSIRDGSVKITPPIKPFLEEKMWFALFWMQPLREFWRRELGEKYFLKLQEVIPYSWPLDPAPLPQHAVIPRLEIHDWREAGKLSQKERDLLIKVSGFSPLGWGSRGIVVGSDVPQTEWQAAIEQALAEFQTTPRLMQRFHKARLLDHPYWDNETGDVKTMRGRVRLCPYYFVENGKVKLTGALATIVPADKKLLHGMRDAILAPGGLPAAA